MTIALPLPGSPAPPDSPVPPLSPHSPAPPERPAPARHRLVEHRTLVWRDASTAQFGVDPDAALVLPDLTPPLVALVNAIDDGRPTADAVADAVARGATPAQVRAVLHALAGAGLLVPAAAPGDDPVRHAYVRIHGGGRIGAAVATLLAGAGVGRVAVRAAGTVAITDVGTGLRHGDVGHPAAAAIATAVARCDPRVEVGEPTRRRPDLVVLTGAATTDPVLLARLLARHQPHLPVTVLAGTGVVGPLVAPGRSSCLHCADLHRTDLDPTWPRLAAQLAGRTRAPDVATASAVAALALGPILAGLRDPSPDGGDDLAGSLVGAVLELDPRTARVVRRDRPPHPACACTPRPSTPGPPRASPPAAGDNRSRAR